jgi:hypothetical protein
VLQPEKKGNMPFFFNKSDWFDVDIFYRMMVKGYAKWSGQNCAPQPWSR